MVERSHVVRHIQLLSIYSFVVPDILMTTPREVYAHLQSFLFQRVHPQMGMQEFDHRNARTSKLSAAGERPHACRPATVVKAIFGFVRDDSKTS